MKREVYDFVTPPSTPKEAVTTLYYFPHQRECGMGLQYRAPAYNDLPCMAAHYDSDGILLFTRFIFKDGTWKDS